MQTSERTYEPGAPNPGASLAVSVFSGASVGLMVGVLLALSVSPVVGIFISALATGLAVLLGLNDQHFSNARALLAEIQKGQQPFEAYARQYTETSLKGNGGDLGWVRIGQLLEFIRRR